MDTLLILRIQEHWFEVFTGKADWRNLGFFHPLENTLGFSDSFFLFGVSHSIFRFLGLDMFEAYAANLTFISLLGYWGMCLLLWRGLALKFPLSLFFSFLFLVSQSITVPALENHLQFLSIWICPWFIWASIEFWRSDEEGVRKHLWGIFSAGSLALLFFNAYYFAWFMVIFACLTVLLNFFLGKGENQYPQPRLKRMQLIRDLTFWFITFFIFLIPFLVTYVPVFLEFGPRNYKYIHQFLPNWNELFHVSDRNWMWGKLVRIIYPLTEMESERTYGVTPWFFTGFVISIIIAFARPRPYDAAKPLKAAIITIVLCWLLLFKVGDVSLWEPVYRWIPGASAIRIPFRMNSFLVLPSLLVMAVGTKTLLANIPKAGKSAKIAVMVLGLLMVLEQWTFSPSHPWRLEANKLRQELGEIPPPPPDATSFYILNKADDLKRFSVIAEFRAMLVSQEFDLPTVNGYSGLFPPKYPFRDILRNHCDCDYDTTMLRWLVEKNVMQGVYALDYPERRWQKIGNLYKNYDRVYPVTPTYTAGEIIPFGLTTSEKETFSAREAIISGFGDMEPNFTWTTGDISKFAVYLKEPISGPLELKIKGRALVNAEHPSQNFAISTNGITLGEFICDLDQCGGCFSFQIPGNNDHMIVITVENLNSISPYELSISQDQRKLGLAIEEVVISAL